MPFSDFERVSSSSTILFFTSEISTPSASSFATATIKGLPETVGVQWEQSASLPFSEASPLYPLRMCGRPRYRHVRGNQRDGKGFPPSERDSCRPKAAQRLRELQGGQHHVEARDKVRFPDGRSTELGLTGFTCSADISSLLDTATASKNYYFRGSTLLITWI